jgi:conjugal transfer/entry exclusion protein
VDVTAALSAAGDLRGFDAKNQLAMVGLKSAMKQQQVVAQVVADAAEGAGRIAASGSGGGAGGASGRGGVLDISV